MNFLHASSRTITSAAFLLAIAALTSRIFGLIRDRILAGKFGAGNELDVYFAAFRVPDLMYNIVIAGAISSAFIPVFVSLYSRNRKEAWRAANDFLNISIVLLLTLGLLFVLAAPFFIPYITPGFDEEEITATILATRIMFLSPLFLGISAILGGILHSFKRFFAYAFAPVFYNLGIIFGAVFLSEPLGIYGLAVGVVIGSFLHFILQVPPVFFSGFAWQAVFDFKNKYFRKIFFLMIPRSLGLVVFQFNLWAITAIASMLPSGSISIFNLANHIQFLPIGIVGYSFATAAMPSFANFAVQESRKKFVAELTKTVHMILFFVFPISAILFVLRAHIVRIAFGTGEFGWTDTRLTAATLGIFCLGIWAHSLIPLLSKVFYAFQNTKTPVIVNSIGFAINIVLSFTFVFTVFQDKNVVRYVSELLDLGGIENISILGLAFAFAIAGVINFTILLLVLTRDIKEVAVLPLVRYGVKIFLISIISGIASYFALYFGESFIETTTALGVLTQAAFSTLVGGLVYVLIMRLLHSPELLLFSRFFKRKFYSNGNGGRI